MINYVPDDQIISIPTEGVSCAFARGIYPISAIYLAELGSLEILLVTKNQVFLNMVDLMILKEDYKNMFVNMGSLNIIWNNRSSISSRSRE